VDARQEMLAGNGGVFRFDADATEFVSDAQHDIFDFIEPVDL
jgi:hypothetical protein